MLCLEKHVLPVFLIHTNSFKFVLYNQYYKKNNNHNLGPYLKYQKGFLLREVVLMYLTKLSMHPSLSLIIISLFIP